MKYNKLSDNDKKQFLIEQYQKLGKSFNDIAQDVGTYSNKIRRDAIKYKIPIRDKSQAQKNALSSGKTKHPTKGTKRSETVKSKIGKGVMDSWENLSDEEIDNRKKIARTNWENLSEDTKADILRNANMAVREASKTGSKLEKYILNRLLGDKYRVDFHKEHFLSNTKLQIDLFLPSLNIAIEVDGPSHFKPVWGNDSLSRNKKYDNKKTGLILGKGWVLIRIVQTKDFSKAQANKTYNILSDILNNIKNKFPDKDSRLIIIGE